METKEHGSPDKVIQDCRRQGVEKVLLLDPAPIVFEMQKTFGDFVVPIPLVHMDRTTRRRLTCCCHRADEVSSSSPPVLVWRSALLPAL